MKYRVTAVAVLMFGTALLQSTLLGLVEFNGVRASLPLVMTIVVALLRSSEESCMMAVLFGLVMDMLGGKTLGWHALFYLIPAILIAMINQKLYRDKIVILMSFAFASTLLVEFLYLVVVFFLKGYDDLGFLLVRLVLPEALMNALLVLPLFSPISRLYNVLDSVDRKRNRIGG